MRRIKVELLLLLLVVGVAAKKKGEVSKKCIGKPDAPKHATVRCFKKNNTCEATCQNGYIFSKKGSKSALFDCEGGKWVMHTGDDKCINEVLKECSGKPNAPEHSTVRCFKKHNTCRATCEHGYIFTKKGGSKSAIYDCEGGKWVMRDGEDKCHSNESALTLKSKTGISTSSQDHDSSNNGRDVNRGSQVRCLPPGYSHEHECFDYHAHYYYYDDDYHPDDYYHQEYLNDYNYCYDDETSGCISSMYLCNGTKHCIPEDYICDLEEDCPYGDDEFDCSGERLLLKSKTDNKTSVDDASTLRKTVKCIAPWYHDHEYGDYPDYHPHPDYAYDIDHTHKVPTSATPEPTATDSIISTTTTLPSCGGEYFSSSGRIHHPMDGGDYYNNQRCYWNIYAGTPVKITFITFDTEYDYDELQVSDIGYSGSGSELGSGPGNVIGIFSGSSVPGPIQTSDIAAYILFTSDSSVTSTGFELYWEPLVTSTTPQPTTTTTDTTTTFREPVTSITPQSTTTADTTTTFETPVLGKNNQNINVNVVVNIN